MKVPLTLKYFLQSFNGTPHPLVRLDTVASWASWGASSSGNAVIYTCMQQIEFGLSLRETRLTLGRQACAVVSLARPSSVAEHQQLHWLCSYCCSVHRVRVLLNSSFACPYQKAPPPWHQSSFVLIGKQRNIAWSVPFGTAGIIGSINMAKLIDNNLDQLGKFLLT